MKPYKLTSKKFKRYTIVEPDMSLYRKARSNDLKDKNTLFNAGKWELDEDAWIRSTASLGMPLKPWANFYLVLKKS